ncbi:catechol 2,3-dioxygenase-like lactoylglutathione lyase family enzyme [Rhodococcus fascians]|uniref:VOC family protein n=1 Tax=Nocardiaceae TaxID=85025 RepID=UPI00050C9EE8|nr:MULTISPECIES: VOC family protein [Rhodococcus]MDR6910778.1 catechol 2,3-dioxygenase-like lactoylglutathione lyase family enzyme [Rhodococcus sp. 3258]MDR6931855.1 catechol 2,3-dioxygenase-like lactoylglutathione lyase family enzyme [Rhodococcus fascians]
MAVRSLNHAVLFVTDVEVSSEFYCSVLGFEQISPDSSGAVFLRGTKSGNDHDLGLFRASAAGTERSGAVGLFHLAWELETLQDLAQARTRLREHGALSGASNHASTKALYGRDPDGIEFELTWLVPDALLDGELVPGVPPTRPLDLDAEIERYGARTPGGPRADRQSMTRLIERMTAAQLR